MKIRAALAPERPAARTDNLEEPEMKRIILAAALALFAMQVSAATCEAMATKKKLAGAAKSSYVKKCETDAMAKCEAAADKKKLSGAARDSNVKKCTQGATGMKSSAACEASADKKKLAGAARSSHIKKCMKDAG